MIEETCNIWDKHAAGHYVCITTNGIVNASGKAVMGRGVALQASRRFPGLADRFGTALVERGIGVILFPDIRLITFPTKYHWKYNSIPELIVHSCKALYLLAEALPGKDAIYLPRPGCSNGGLDWENVRELIRPHLHPRVVICHMEAKP